MRNKEKQQKQTQNKQKTVTHLQGIKNKQTVNSICP